MAEPPKKLSARTHGSEVVGEALPTKFERTESLFSVTNSFHMNPEASEAMIRATENQFAIPAQEETKRAIERTKRAQEETKRFQLRVLGYPPVLAIGIVGMVIARDQTGTCMWIAFALIGVLGSVEAVQAFDRYLSREKKGTRE